MNYNPTFQRYSMPDDPSAEAALPQAPQPAPTEQEAMPMPAPGGPQLSYPMMGGGQAQGLNPTMPENLRFNPAMAAPPPQGPMSYPMMSGQQGLNPVLPDNLRYSPGAVTTGYDPYAGTRIAAQADPTPRYSAQSAENSPKASSAEGGSPKETMTESGAAKDAKKPDHPSFGRKLARTLGDALSVYGGGSPYAQQAPDLTKSMQLRKL